MDMLRHCPLSIEDVLPDFPDEVQINEFKVRAPRTMAPLCACHVTTRVAFREQRSSNLSLSQTIRKHSDGDL